MTSKIKGIKIIQILIVAAVFLAIIVHQLILFGIYFSVYNVKHSQVSFYLIRLDTYFRNINFLSYKIKNIKDLNCAFNSVKNENIATIK